MDKSIVSMIAKFRVAYSYAFKDLDESSIIGMVNIYKEQLQDYESETIDYVSNFIISKEKYLPSIAEIKELCEKHRFAKFYPVIEEMDKKGYFKNTYEKEKILKWMQEGIIPEWFKKDMAGYFNNIKIDIKERNLLT